MHTLRIIFNKISGSRYVSRPREAEMKTVLLFLITIFSTHLHAERFPTNVEIQARASMENYLNSDKKIINPQVLDVKYIDMDPRAAYYLGVVWTYSNQEQQSFVCYSEVGLTILKDQTEDFYELMRDCL